MTGSLVAVGWGILVGTIVGLPAGLLVRYLGRWCRWYRSGRPKPAPEFKRSVDQDPIDPPRKPGETRISRINYARETSTRRLVKRSKQEDQK